MKPESINTEKVLECIKRGTKDKRVSKSAIAYYLKLPYSNSHNNAIDRAIRDAVTELRKRGEPVCSSAGQAGYWYDPAHIDMVIADYRSRIIDMSETIRALERGRKEPVQATLWG